MTERTDMLIIPVMLANLDLLKALNDGFVPANINEDEGNPLFLVMESGKTNRIIDSDELNEMMATMTTKRVTQEMFYVV